MKLVRTAALLLAMIAGAAQAHDSWLEPKSFEVAAGARVPVTFYVGHHGEQQSATLSPRRSWLLRMRAIGPHGSTDLLKLRQFDPARGIPLGRAGAYVLTLDTADFRQTATPEEFVNYMAEEGLSAAQAAWKRAPIRGRNVRESYRRHAKSLVKVGSGSPATGAHVRRRVGQRLEIVPVLNPYALRAGEPLGAKIWFRDKPLARAQVTLSSLDRPTDEHLSARSNGNGEVTFNLPSVGRWMMTVVWSERSATAGTDFQTSFSSLTFAVPQRR